MRLFVASAFTVAMLSLSACNPANDAASTPPATDTATPPAPVAVAPAPVAAPAPVTLWFEPAGVSTCEKSATVVVHWNARSVAGVKTVEVRPLGPGGKEGLFVKGGPLGSRETGPWMSAGRTMILRNPADGSEIGRAKLGGLPCTQ